jgi:hypothetical protein
MNILSNLGRVLGSYTQHNRDQLEKHSRYVLYQHHRDSLYEHSCN